MILYTPLPVSECISQLNSAIDDDKLSWLFERSFEGKPILGRVDGMTFRLHKRRQYRNGFAPHFYGKFVVSDNCTLIHAEFDLQKASRIFMTLWFGFLGFFFLMQLGLSIHGGDYSPLLVALVGSGIMAIGGLGVVKLGQWLARNEKQYILEFLRDTIQASVLEEKQ